jgi:predicted ATPase/DNA-binding SARP family transcriptional activator
VVSVNDLAAAGALKFGILGPIEAWSGDQRLMLAGPKQVALLAFLLLHANQAVSFDSVIDAVWGSAPPGAGKRLQVAVARLRKALQPMSDGSDPPLRTVSGGYVLTARPGELDAHEFASGVQHGRAKLEEGDAVSASELLARAIGLWRGPALAEVAFEDFAQAEIRRLEELRLVAIESRVDAELQLGSHRQLIGELESRVAQHPMREHLVAQLMLALYRSGRQGDALEVYQRTRSHLVQELGVEPGHALKNLQADILEQAAALEVGQTWLMPGPRRAPEGTVALLVGDIEGSTRAAGELGASLLGVLEEHRAIVRGAIEGEGGFTEGSDRGEVFAVFADPRAAARAAVAAVRGLLSHAWPAEVGELGVRMGLHVGYVERTDQGYVGLEIDRAVRIAEAAHGGQLLLTNAARAVIGDELVSEPLGVHRIKDFPSPELLFCAVIDGRGAASFPPPRTRPIRQTNLPAGLPPLVGREPDVERVRNALSVDRERLVTLTGRGGVGKTSLALTVAASLLDEYPGGVWLASLSTVTSPQEVLPVLAGVIGAERDRDDPPLDAITNRLCGRGPTLIVLDNLEHLLEAANSILAVLERSPEVRVLVTSQAPLRVTSECCFAVGGLDEDAALVLIERVARRRAGSFGIADAEHAALGEIVTMLDGLPLALELAAARLALLTPGQLRDRLRTSSDVLRDDVRDRTDRQRSLRATVQWTLEPLDDSSRRLFVRMGAFAGSVELHELEAVAGADGLDVLESLSCLVEVALPRRVETGDGRVTFGFPEALRQIAAAMLDEQPDGQRWRHEHARRQHQLLWAARNLDAPQRVHEAAIAADTEAAAALQWARAIGDPVAMPLAAARATLLAYDGRAPVEALAILEPLLNSPPADPEVSGQARIAQSIALAILGRPAGALAAANAALALEVEDSTRAQALISRAVAHRMMGQVDAALADHEQATGLTRHLNPEALGRALMHEAFTRLGAGQLDLASALVDESEQIGADLSHFGSRHEFDGVLALLRHRPQEAARHFALALERDQERAAHMDIYSDLIGLADALAMNNDDIGALEVYGIAEAQITEMGGSEHLSDHADGRNLVLDSLVRVGAHVAAETKARGRSVAAGYRVTRGCEIARAAIRRSTTT